MRILELNNIENTLKKSTKLKMEKRIDILRNLTWMKEILVLKEGSDKNKLIIRSDLLKVAIIEKVHIPHIG